MCASHSRRARSVTKRSFSNHFFLPCCVPPRATLKTKEMEINTTKILFPRPFLKLPSFARSWCGETTSATCTTHKVREGTRKQLDRVCIAMGVLCVGKEETTKSYDRLPSWPCSHRHRASSPSDVQMHPPASQSLLTAPVKKMPTCPRVNEFFRAYHVQVLHRQPAGAAHLRDEHHVMLRLPHRGGEVSEHGSASLFKPHSFFDSDACNLKEALNTPSVTQPVLPSGFCGNALC